MGISMNGLRLNMASNILDFADEISGGSNKLEEKALDKLDQVLRDIRFLGSINFREGTGSDDGGFIYDEMDKLFIGYLED